MNSLIKIRNVLALFKRAYLLIFSSVQFSSVAQLILTLQYHALQNARPPCPSPTPGGYSNSCPLSWWCHSTLSFSVVPLLLLLSIFPKIRAFSSESAPDIRLPKYCSFSFSISHSNFQNWFPLRLTGLICLQSKGLSRVFSYTTVQKYQFFGAQLFSWSNSNTHTWQLEKP